MTNPKIEISLALEADEDWPVADVMYDGDHWASVALVAPDVVATIYGQTAGHRPIPVEVAIESLERAKRQLLDIVGDDWPPAS
jgi:hypothetical protein